MKKISIVLMIVGTLWTAQAQKPTHYVGLSAKLGYSAMLDNMNKIGLDTVFYSGKNSVLGGVATGLDATYELQVQKFRFGIITKFRTLMLGEEKKHREQHLKED